VTLPKCHNHGSVGIDEAGQGQQSFLGGLDSDCDLIRLELGAGRPGLPPCLWKFVHRVEPLAEPARRHFDFDRMRIVASDSL